MKKLLQKIWRWINPPKRGFKITPAHKHGIEIWNEKPFPDKRYSEMSRYERRLYERWLHKNNLWDGEIVIKNMEKSKRLHYKS